MFFNKSWIEPQKWMLQTTFSKKTLFLEYFGISQFPRTDITDCWSYYLPTCNTMNETAQISEIGGLVELVFNAFKGPSLFTLEEVGVFNAAPPDAFPGSSQSYCETAIQATSRHFGLASWALNPLYVSCKRRLASRRDDIAAATAILIVSPDFLTAWNVRKTMFKREEVDRELHFSAIVLTRSPKSAEAWAHRHWIIHTVGVDCVQHSVELRLAWMAASRAFSNYYATVHRIRVLHAVDDVALSRELTTSRSWLRTHIGDSSGWTYHRAILKALFQRQALPQNDETTWFSQMFRNYASAYQNIKIHNLWLPIINVERLDKVDTR